jgi:hypothetical protein
MKKKVILLISVLIVSLVLVCAFTACGRAQNSINPIGDGSTATTEQGIQTENSEAYDVIYEDFLNSTKWREVEDTTQWDEPFEVNSVEIESKKIFDLDGDGVPELWFVARTPGDGGGEEVSSFCTIIENEVKVLLSGYRSGGTIGGDWIGICFDNGTSKHIVGLFGYTGGFGGIMSWAVYYSYEEGTLNRIIDLNQMSQPGKQYDGEELQDPSLYFIEEDSVSFSGEPYISVYKVNDKQVTKEAYEEVVDRFVDPKDKEFILEEEHVTQEKSDTQELSFGGALRAIEDSYTGDMNIWPFREDIYFVAAEVNGKSLFKALKDDPSKKQLITLVANAPYEKVDYDNVFFRSPWFYYVATAGDPEWQRDILRRYNVITEENEILLKTTSDINIEGITDQRVFFTEYKEEEDFDDESTVLLSISIDDKVVTEITEFLGYIVRTNEKDGIFYYSCDRYTEQLTANMSMYQVSDDLTVEQVKDFSRIGALYPEMEMDGWYYYLDHFKEKYTTISRVSVHGGASEKLYTVFTKDFISAAHGKLFISGVRDGEILMYDPDTGAVRELLDEPYWAYCITDDQSLIYRLKDGSLRIIEMK